MELKHLYTQHGDVVMSPGDNGDPLLTYSSGGFVCIIPDTPRWEESLLIHHSQIDDLIEALKIMKENKNV